MNKLYTIALAVLLAGCGAHPGTPSEVKVQIEKVAVRAPCPSPEVYKDITANRPVPLVKQAMPADPDVRVARTTAQLGKYEARGGWADQVQAVLDRCQAGEDLTPSP